MGAPVRLLRGLATTPICEYFFPHVEGEQQAGAVHLGLTVRFGGGPAERDRERKILQRLVGELFFQGGRRGDRISR